MVDLPFIILDSLAICLILIPSPWHLAAWNTATCYMMLWTLIGCLIHLVGAIVWADNVIDHNPTYCDIATKLIVGLSIALPLSSFCINRRLFNIATMKTITITKEQKRRNVIIDTAIAVGGPIIFMAIHYTMQGHRFDIIEGFGCWPDTYATAPAFVLVLAPPIVVTFTSLCTAALTVRAFLKRRNEFNELLNSSATGLNSGRYFRLMALACSEIALGFPASLYFFIVDLVNSPIHPWISWADTHSYFSHINYYPSYFLAANKTALVTFEMSRWAWPFNAFMFFIFFGFADEARRNYRKAYYAVLRPFGVRPPAANTTGKSVSIFGRYLGRRGARNGTSTTGTSPVVVSLPKYSSNLKPPAMKPSASSNSLAECELTMPTLDLAALEGADEKTAPSDPTSPPTPSQHEYTCNSCGVRKTVETETHVV